MARLEIIKIHDEEVLINGWMEPFKQYASVPDEGRDALLRGLLRTAVLRVQEYSDRALLRCRVRQVCTPDPETGLVRLYLGGGEVVSVTYDYGGEEAPYERLAGDSLRVNARGSAVAVEFDTIPRKGWIDQAATTVYRLGTALYDGASVDVCNSILNEVL